MPALQNEEKAAVAVNRLAARLAAAGIEESQLKAEWAAAHVLGCPRLALRLQAERMMSPSSAAQLAALGDRLARGEPLQYVLGVSEFYGREFRVDPRALVPRPETEELVELAVKISKGWNVAEGAVAGVGTGSGCIAVTMALERSGLRVYATDPSAEALALARENAARHGVESRITFLRGSGLTPLATTMLDLVVSNPPYIASSALAELPRDVRDYEPRQALDGGPDGLQVIAQVIRESADRLRPDGMILLEIGEDQEVRVVSLLASAGFRGATVRCDVAGHPRFAMGTQPDV